MGKIEICDKKTLYLTNVLINRIVQLSLIDDNDCAKGVSIETELSKMNNVFRMKNVRQVGPLIQSSVMNRYSEEKLNIEVNLMLQANEYFDAPKPYRMKESIVIPNCVYARFHGSEEDMKYAYQKIEVYAYEKDIELLGDSYTVYLDSNEDGTIIVDIFMERKDGE